MRPAGALRISGRRACVERDDREEIRLESLPEDLQRHRGRRVEPARGPELGVLQHDARVIDQDVELAVTRFQMPGDFPVVLGTGDVEPNGLDALDALGSELVGGGAALRLVAAGQHDRDAQLAKPTGGFESDPLVRPGDERDFLLSCHGLPPLAGSGERDILRNGKGKTLVPKLRSGNARVRELLLRVRFLDGTRSGASPTGVPKQSLGTRIPTEQHLLET